MKLKSILVGSSIIAMLILASCSGNSSSQTSSSSSPAAAETSDKIVVGMELQFAPFETIDTNGKPAGLSVDIAYELGEYLDKEIVIEEMAYSGLIPALLSKKIDLIISSMTITDARLEQVDFSDPYASSHLSLLIHADSPVQGPADLNNAGIKVAVKKGTTGQIHAETSYPNAEILAFEKDSEGIMEVVQGRADVFIYDVYTIHKNHALNPNTTRVYLEAINQDGVEKWGMAMRKNEDELKSGVNAFIAEIQNNGKLDEIVGVHLTDIKKIFDDNNLEFFF